MNIGIIPGPHEPKVNINTFLQPLVDDLLELFNGIPLIGGDGSFLRAALICITSDLPAMRKVTQFLGHKADLGCSRCKFKAEREPGTTGASGRMSYFTSKSASCDARTHEQVLEQAREYKYATSKSAASIVAQNNGVRYSELLRLPYFDIVRMSFTDPMHTLFLGMVKHETNLNLKMLTCSKRQELIRRIKSVRMPYDIGRLPTNIFDDGECIGGITADQWKIYITLYAQACMYKLLPDRAYKCLVILAKIARLIVSPIFTDEDISTLHRSDKRPPHISFIATSFSLSSRLLQDHHELFTKVYEKWEVTVNYHMILHLPDMISDLGPPHTFWCFGYERMNGILAGTPNSNRCIELEVMNRFVMDTAFSNTCTPNVDISNVPHPLKEFILASDDSLPRYPQTFRLICLLSERDDRDRFEIQQDLDRGLVEDWPVIFKHPQKLNTRCKSTILKEIQNFFEDLYETNLDYILPRIDKFGRCEVNGMKFSSEFNSTDRANIVKAMYVDSSGELTPYFGIIKFFFKTSIVVDGKSLSHELAYVTWLKFRFSGQDPVSNLYGVSKDTYRKDKIISPRRFVSRCVLFSPNTRAPLYLVSELMK